MLERSVLNVNKSLLESHLWIASVTPANQHGFLKVRSMEFLTWNYHVKLFRFQGHPPPPTLDQFGISDHEFRNLYFL